MDVGNETMLRRMIVVKRFGEQRGNSEELYRSVGSNKVYIRQDIRDDEHVVWCTASKWQGGYEADAPLKAGTIVCVYGQNDIELFVETTETAPCGSWAKKQADFAWEIESKLGCWAVAQYGLASHDEWSSWLMSMNVNSEERDNWLYFYVEALQKRVVHQTSQLGRAYTIICAHCRHLMCGAEWDAYLLIDENCEIAAILGFRFEDQQTFDIEDGDNT